MGRKTTRQGRLAAWACIFAAVLFTFAGTRATSAENGPGHGEHGVGDGHDHEGHGHEGHDHVHTHAGYDFSAWELVPVQEGGLEKSLYTLARDTIREYTGKVNYGGRGPMENFFSLIYEPRLWLNESILKLNHPELKKLFDGRKHISAAELISSREQWMPLTEKKDSTGREIKMELENLHRKIDMIAVPIESLNIVPVVNFRGQKDKWRSIEDLAHTTKEKTPQEERLIAAWDAMGTAFVSDNAEKFNAAAREGADALKSLGVETFTPAWKVRLDRWDAKVGLFRVAGWVYLVSALIFLASYLAGKKFFTITAAATLGLGVALHAAALTIRGILAERTPVANLFESAVFIIGAMTLLSCLIALYYRARIVGLAGAALGAFFMGIANTVPLHYGRKIMPLIDALQSYWLHIHVTSMLISYAFFALSFFVAAAYIARMIFLGRGGGGGGGAAGGGGELARRDLTGDSTLQYLDSLNFRIITIGFPILTGGVILGAVWASEAWGRPWAFDPKETAAAITWMIYALYLHARLFLGWRGPKGIWLSILGFGAVVFTYLGVSFFLPGLHSYVSDGMSFTDFLKKMIPGI